MTETVAQTFPLAAPTPVVCARVLLVLRAVLALALVLNLREGVHERAA